MNPVVAAAALLLLAPLATTPPQQKTITKSEIRRDSPHRTDIRLRDTVWDMFEKQDMRRRGQPRFPLRDVWLSTRPRGTDVPNLCRYDSVRIEFAKAGPDAGADTEVQAVGITAEPNFHFIAPPSGPYLAAVRDGLVATEGGCGSIRADSTSFFQAEDSEVATDGYRAFLNLQDALRAGRPLPVTCDQSSDETQSCRDVILGLGQADFSFISKCAEDGHSPPCFVLDGYVHRLEITIGRGDRDLNPTAAKHNLVIVIADSLID